MAVPSIHTAGQPPRSRLGTRTRVSIMPYFTDTNDLLTTLPDVYCSGLPHWSTMPGPLSCLAVMRRAWLPGSPGTSAIATFSAL